MPATVVLHIYYLITDKLKQKYLSPGPITGPLPGAMQSHGPPWGANHRAPPQGPITGGPITGGPITGPSPGGKSQGPSPGVQSQGPSPGANHRGANHRPPPRGSNHRAPPRGSNHRPLPGGPITGTLPKGQSQAPPQGPITGPSPGANHRPLPEGQSQAPPQGPITGPLPGGLAIGPSHGMRYCIALWICLSTGIPVPPNMWMSICSPRQMMNVSNWGSQPRANNTGKQRMKTEGGGRRERVCGSSTKGVYQ